ncbi:acetyl-CoA carboxylase biotin carboxylase subunit [Endozoicomonas sp. SM1973]|uniref:Biotin carboxylase n=1 Tax=Spartinivicinus marinus TaxID=2994442 RepID=A0A853IGF6_9GAMM|nr:acetyl-CoA carboxylase biotin carboxylase subunit [Spartinivicinus marinus]MCX4028681.1 acetyl-CoA carboxylase biotin carboxylase subunit [Spartinivicinus marinus]NYZ69094.1 acetyl-CoA carboxylase biotin carboxylase subunit [Spartinivicinus marinus]
MMNKVLVANRGEIAVRVINAAHQLGYQTVAVFSEADRAALHISLADQAVLIGAANSRDSYLNIAAVINAAKKVEADAIHPGYGFLAENADFAQACEEAGLIFIGPSSEAIHMMGNKAQAKDCMEVAGVPCIPGYRGHDQQLHTFQQQAEGIGFPVYIKAALGGGGRGMRQVMSTEELPAAIESAKSEAKSAVGDDQLILEKAIIHGRHIEFQILADRQGHTIHLGERDCSLQRRHQKVIEETPSPALSEVLRQRMGEVAVGAAKAIGYIGAGTVEFLLAESGEFYFLEMNTRLQVEHPVTEMVTGIDLVKWQLKIADGQPLTVQQQDILMTGHAIEARLYAEDPDQQFLPQTGDIKFCRFPKVEGVRYDRGVKTGQAISAYYDPMLAKIIGTGETREEARRRLIRALQQIVLLGPITNRQFLVELLQSSVFIAGKTHCQFIEEQFVNKSVSASERDKIINSQLIALAAISVTLSMKNVHFHRHWGWRNSGLASGYCRLKAGNNSVFNCKLQKLSYPFYQIMINELPAIDLEIVSIDDYQWRYSVEGVVNTAYVLVEQDQVFVADQAQQICLKQLSFESTQQLEQAHNNISAPISGCVVKVLVEINQAVTKGDRLAVIEAMKMEHMVVAPLSGTIDKVYIASGQQVQAGTLLIDIHPS